MKLFSVPITYTFQHWNNFAFRYVSKFVFHSEKPKGTEITEFVTRYQKSVIKPKILAASEKA